MRWFGIWQEEDSAQNYTFNVSHKWTIPAVRCDACGWTGRVSKAVYPRVNLPRTLKPKPYLNVFPEKPERIGELMAPILPLIPPGLPFGAGAEFGRLTGHCSRRKGDFTWTNYGVPLISRSALERVFNYGVKSIKTVKTDVFEGKNKAIDYLELDIEPRAHVDPSVLAPNALERCPTCGVLKLNSFPIDPKEDEKPLVILRDSIPQECDLVSVWECADAILASERLIEAIKSLCLTGNSYVEMPLS
jgi:uncharacterized double-CXXCG motif protein